MSAFALAKALRQLASAPSRVSPAWAEYVRKETRRFWQSGMEPSGAAWSPLAASTIARKGHDRILQRMNKMFPSLKVRALSGAGIAMTVDSPADKHQKGGPDLPIRRMLPEGNLPGPWRKELERLIHESYGRG